MKKIIFASGKELPYINAFSLEKDYKEGYTRPSVEVSIPFAETSFDEINNLAGTNFTLVGEPILDENNEVIETPTSEWNDYSIKGKISVDDNTITFKCYKLSDIEIALDELLISMEV